MIYLVRLLRGLTYRQQLDVGVASMLKGCMHAAHGYPVKGEADMYKLGGTLLLADLPVGVLFRRHLQEIQVIISWPSIALSFPYFHRLGFEQRCLPHATRNGIQSCGSAPDHSRARCTRCSHLNHAEEVTRHSQQGLRALLGHQSCSNLFGGVVSHTQIHRVPEN